MSTSIALATVEEQSSLTLGDPAEIDSESLGIFVRDGVIGAAQKLVELKPSRGAMTNSQMPRARGSSASVVRRCSDRPTKSDDGHFAEGQKGDPMPAAHEERQPLFTRFRAW